MTHFKRFAFNRSTGMMAVELENGAVDWFCVGEDMPAHAVVQNGVMILHRRGHLVATEEVSDEMRVLVVPFCEGVE